jgi:hypothetical protein
LPDEFINVELPSVRLRKPDLIGRLPGGALLHLELQGDNETNMEWREIEYYVMISRLLGKPPIQVVLYFGNEPMTMRNFIVTESLQYRYILRDIRSIKAEYLLSSDSLSDNVLAVLCGDGAEPEIIRDLAARMRQLPDKERRDWLEKPMVLSGIRGVENLVRKEAENMGISLDIRQNKFYQEAYAAGAEDSLESTLKLLLGHRFGSLPEWVFERVESMDRTKLEEAILRVSDAKTLEEALPIARNGSDHSSTIN